MSRFKLPNTEDVWGNIQTKHDYKFVITYSAINKKYYLYHKSSTGYIDVSSSSNPFALLKKINEYENELMIERQKRYKM